MTLPRIATRDEWLAARKDLLVKEKELTRQRDALNAERRELPMVEVDKDYVFEGPEGQVRLHRPLRGPPAAHHLPLHVRPRVGGRLPELHRRHRRAQRPASSTTSTPATPATPSCPGPRWRSSSAGASKRGWDHLRWYSSFGSDFNYDFRVSIDESVRPVEYNFRTKAEYEAMGSRRASARSPSSCPVAAASCTVDGRVFHTYSQYARGLESTGGSYYFLDLTALGRQEDWEEPKGRAESARAARPDFATLSGPRTSDRASRGRPRRTP